LSTAVSRTAAGGGGRGPARRRFLGFALAGAGLACVSPGRLALGAEFKPVIGQPGRDVIWVPTPQAAVDLMLDMAKLAREDFVIDLGSGDGRIVLTAAKRGARGYGVDLNADMVKLSNDEASRQGIAERARFYVRDLFQTDIGEASVLSMYLLPQLNIRLRPTILAAMKPGSRVVSHAFHMGEWQPDAVEQAENRTAHLWIVPAPAMGLWRWENDGAGFTRTYEMQVAQQFQMVSGKAISTSGGSVYLRDMTLSGPDFSFTLTEESGSAMSQTRYSGRIEGDAITGTARTSGQKVPQRWTAKRLSGATEIEKRT